MELTIPEVYIRFANNCFIQLETDKLRIDEWITRINNWLIRSLEKIYFIIATLDTEPPYLAQYVTKQFNLHLGASVPQVNIQYRNT
jgi:hypothetical protein